MSAHPKPASNAVDLSALPRKRCENCPQFFRLTKPKRRFCSAKCRLEFHTHGSSYGKLKDKLTKLIHEESRGIVGEEFGRYVSGKDFKRALSAAGFIHRSQIIKRSPEARPTALLRRLQAQAGIIQNLNQRLTSIEAAFASGPAAPILALLTDQSEGTPRSAPPTPEQESKTALASNDTAIAGLKAFNTARRRAKL